MTDRQTEIAGFLRECDLSTAQMKSLAGDASSRRYFRLSDGARPLVLMDAPPSKGEDVRPFIHIGQWLQSVGLSSPKTIHADPDRGFLLLEDLGDDLIARVVEKDKTQEETLYGAATDVLLDLHGLKPPTGLAIYTPRIMAEVIEPAFEWYLRGCGGNTSQKNELIDRFEDILNTHCPTADVVVLRDYHAENLLWLPDRKGVKRVGILDFQDALIGHRAYDLVSLLHDIRREVTPAVEEAMINRYLEASGLDETSFRAAFSVLGVQRNLRILGVFARLCIVAGKRSYIDYLPRVWSLILKELEHPSLNPIRSMLLDTIPAPSAKILNMIKDQCATAPTQ